MQEARTEALQGIRSILSAEVAAGELDMDGRIEVLDHSRRLVSGFRSPMPFR